MMLMRVLISALIFNLAIVTSVQGKDWTPQNPQGQPWQPNNPSGQSAGLNDGGRIGKKVVEKNAMIKEKRSKLLKIKEEKGLASDDYQKAARELSELRKERDRLIESLPEGRGLKYKIRRATANDRKMAEEEQAQFESFKKENPGAIKINKSAESDSKAETSTDSESQTELQQKSEPTEDIQKDDDSQASEPDEQ